MKKYIAIASLLTMLATQAVAEDTTKTIYADKRADLVVVWRDTKAMTEGVSMARAGVHKTNPGLIRPLIACIVNDRTHAIVSDGGFFASDVVIIDGQSVGCRGTIANENLHPPK